jgi:Mce-associated membrane protein
MTADEAESSGEHSESPIDSTEAPTGDVESLLLIEASAPGAVLIGRLIDRARAHWRPILLVALVIASIGLTIGLFVLQYRPDREIDDQAAHQAIRAASDGAVALLSYSSDSLDRDFSDAKTRLTGDFLDYYIKFTRDFVAPTVRDKHLTQKAVAIRSAAVEMHSTSAVVLVFLNETTTSADKKDPLKTPSSVRVTLEKVDGSWLISKLDPVG